MITPIACTCYAHGSCIAFECVRFLQVINNTYMALWHADTWQSFVWRLNGDFLPLFLCMCVCVCVFCLFFFSEGQRFESAKQVCVKDGL